MTHIASDLPGAAELTVNELLQRHPDLLTTLHSLGIHTCCGGGLSLEAAAVNAGITPRHLLDQIAVALGEGASP